MTDDANPPGPLEPLAAATEPEPPEPPEPPSAPAPPVPPIPPVESTPRPIGVSFDLLNRSSEEMRRASFYIGTVLLGTVGPFAVASWALEVVSLHKTRAQLESILAAGAEAWLGLLGAIAFAGLLVAAIEGRTMASAILGGRLVGRPLSVRGSLARSRMSFWRVIIGSFIVAIPVAAAQLALAPSSRPRSASRPTSRSCRRPSRPRSPALHSPTCSVARSGSAPAPGLRV